MFHHITIKRLECSRTHKVSLFVCHHDLFVLLQPKEKCIFIVMSRHCDHFYLPGVPRYLIYLRYNSEVTSVQECRKTVIGVEVFIYLGCLLYWSTVTSTVKINAKCFVVQTRFYMKFCCHCHHLLLLCLHQANFHHQIKIALSELFQKVSSHSVSFSFQNISYITRRNCVLLRSGLLSSCGCTDKFVKECAYVSVLYVLTLRLKPLQCWQIHVQKKAVVENHTTYHSCPVCKKVYSVRIVAD